MDSFINSPWHSRPECHTPLANTSFNEILDLTAETEVFKNGAHTKRAFDTHVADRASPRLLAKYAPQTPKRVRLILEFSPASPP